MYVALERRRNTKRLDSKESSSGTSTAGVTALSMGKRTRLGLLYKWEYMEEWGIQQGADIGLCSCAWMDLVHKAQIPHSPPQIPSALSVNKAALLVGKWQYVISQPSILLTHLLISPVCRHSSVLYTGHKKGPRGKYWAYTGDCPLTSGSGGTGITETQISEGCHPKVVSSARRHHLAGVPLLVTKVDTVFSIGGTPVSNIHLLSLQCLIYRPRSRHHWKQCECPSAFLVMKNTQETGEMGFISCFSLRQLWHSKEHECQSQEQEFKPLHLFPGRRQRTRFEISTAMTRSCVVTVDVSTKPSRPFISPLI